MRINKFVASGTGLSRRAADKVIQDGRILVNDTTPEHGYDVQPGDRVTIDGRVITAYDGTTTIMLNKPAGYVCSRTGQGSKTIYDLLPKDMHHLKPVGRLDKDSSGLLLLTNDGGLANRLTHPRYQKEKLYEVTLDTPLAAADRARIEKGVQLDDGPSKLKVRATSQESRAGDAYGSSPRTHDSTYEVRLSEGRNRQIRRTFATLGYTVTTLHRLQLGDYTLNSLPPGHCKTV